jgi:hypothetical protein
MSTRRLASAIAAALAVALAAEARGQVASPSAAALGMGGNHTAGARGYEAVAWNPAALAMSGAPRLSLSVGALLGMAGFGPVSLDELARHQDRLLPDEVRDRWMREIRASGGQEGSAGADVTLLAVQYARFAGQLSTTVRALGDISPGVAELLLFGNADDAGNPREIPLDGSTIAMHAYTTGAVSWATPVPLRRPGERLSVGVTASYTAGHALAVAARSEGAATADPVGVEFRFPLVHTDFGDDTRAVSGGGMGLDVGALWERDGWSAGLVLRNLVSTFAWNEARFRYREAAVALDAERRHTDFEPRPLDAAPAGVSRLVDEARFRPSVALGARMRASSQLEVAGDARLGPRGGIGSMASRHLGAGVEYRPRARIPLRAGLAFVEDLDGRQGAQLAAGAGVEMGSFRMAVSVARRTGDTLLMLNLLSVVR